MGMFAALAVIIRLRAVAIAPECDSVEPGACVASGGSSMLQQMPSAICDPCKVIETIDGVQLRMDVFAKPKSWARPLVLMFHGKGVSFSHTNSICKHKLYADGNFVCASVMNTKYGNIEQEIKVTEVALNYLNHHASTYVINPGKIFLYGYSAGGIHLAKFMTKSDDPLRDRILGLMIDSGTPGQYWSDLTKNKREVPPILMLHCGVDPQMQPKKTINPGIKNIGKVNKARAGTDIPPVQFHYMKYTADSKCTHKPRGHFPSGLDALKSFMQQMLSIYNGAAADPFEGIADKVIEPEKPW